MTIDNASFSKRSTVPTPNRETSNIWAPNTLLPLYTYRPLMWGGGREDESQALGKLLRCRAHSSKKESASRARVGRSREPPNLQQAQFLAKKSNRHILMMQAAGRRFFFFFFFTHICFPASGFWTSRGRSCRPFSPPVFVFNFYRA